jgi:tRNA A37 methylthiotransferase MiaB
LHAFPFSAHVDHYHVPAGYFPDQVQNHIKHERLRTLLEAGKKTFEDFSKIHQHLQMKVLLEKV